MIPLRVAGWISLTAAQPLLLEGSGELMAWWLGDPLAARLGTTAGAATMVGALCTAPVNEYKLWVRSMRSVPYRSPQAVWERAMRNAAILHWIYAVAWGLAAFSAVAAVTHGLANNWAYRPANLILQIEVVVLWVLACATERDAWHAEWAAKRIGLVMASIGLAAFLACQIVWPDTPFLGTMASYDPRTGPVSAINVATGFPWAVFILPAISLCLTAALTAWHVWRCRRRRWLHV